MKELDTFETDGLPEPISYLDENIDWQEFKWTTNASVVAGDILQFIDARHQRIFQFESSDTRSGKQVAGRLTIFSLGLVETDQAVMDLIHPIPDFATANRPYVDFTIDRLSPGEKGVDQTVITPAFNFAQITHSSSLAEVAQKTAFLNRITGPLRGESNLAVIIKVVKFFTELAEREEDPENSWNYSFVALVLKRELIPDLEAPDMNI